MPIKHEEIRRLQKSDGRKNLLNDGEAIPFFLYHGFDLPKTRLGFSDGDKDLGLLRSGDRCVRFLHTVVLIDYRPLRSSDRSRLFEREALVRTRDHASSAGNALVMIDFRCRISDLADGACRTDPYQRTDMILWTFRRIDFYSAHTVSFSVISIPMVQVQNSGRKTACQACDHLRLFTTVHRIHALSTGCLL